MKEPSDPTLASYSLVGPGTRLNGIYVIDRLVATGGMGQVYVGHTVETADQVAIKMIRPELAESDTHLALFRKEAAALHRTTHDAIVRYFVFTTDPDLRCPYLAMEFVEGESLARMLERGPLDLDTVRILQRRIAAGLDMAHRAGVIHRDVSPDNIILPDNDPTRAKIIDFGIARDALGAATVIGGDFAGKSNYVSPEQIGLFGGEVTSKSDIYSLGLTLAAALLGRQLDMGGLPADMVRKRSSVPDLSEIPAEMRPLLGSMLQPRPEDRPASMADVASWPTDRTTASAQPVPRRDRRWIVPAAVVALVGAGVIGMLRVGDLHIRKSEGLDLPQPGPSRPTAEAPRGAATQPVETRPQASGSGPSAPSERIAAAPPSPDKPPSQSPPAPSAAASAPIAVGPAPPSTDTSPSQSPPAPSVAASAPIAAGPAPPSTDASPSQSAPAPSAPASAPIAVGPAPPSALPNRATATELSELRPSVLSPSPAPPQPGPATPSPLPVALSNPAAPGAFRDCDSCPELIPLPTGTLAMGSNADPSEKPIHKVTVSRFAVGLLPVTVAEWRLCVAAKGCSFDPGGDPGTPVHNLSWDDAQQYLDWLSRLTGHRYRMLSEAEWEYAARANAKTRYWWGDQFRPDMTSCRSCDAQTSPDPPKAGLFPPNPFGLRDVTGSVSQWVGDCWHKNFKGAPTNGSAWEAPRCAQRVLRGGSWASTPGDLRITNREFYDQGVRYPGHGLRVARDMTD